MKPLFHAIKYWIVHLKHIELNFYTLTKEDVKHTINYENFRGNRYDV